MPTKVHEKVPLSFEARNRPVAGQVEFISRAGVYTLHLTPEEAVFEWRGDLGSEVGCRNNNRKIAISRPAGGRHWLGMKLVRANPDVKLQGEERLAGKTTISSEWTPGNGGQTPRHSQECDITASIQE